MSHASNIGNHTSSRYTGYLQPLTIPPRQLTDLLNAAGVPNRLRGRSNRTDNPQFTSTRYCEVPAPKGYTRAFAPSNILPLNLPTPSAAPVLRTNSEMFDWFDRPPSPSPLPRSPANLYRFTYLTPTASANSSAVESMPSQQVPAPGATSSLRSPSNGSISSLASITRLPSMRSSSSSSPSAGPLSSISALTYSTVHRGSHIGSERLPSGSPVQSRQSFPSNSSGQSGVVVSPGAEVLTDRFNFGSVTPPRSRNVTYI
jgi:hypothetical protein